MKGIVIDIRVRHVIRTLVFDLVIPKVEGIEDRQEPKPYSLVSERPDFLDLQLVVHLAQEPLGVGDVEQVDLDVDAVQLLLQQLVDGRVTG